jgi:molecular chaperone GrpE
MQPESENEQNPKNEEIKPDDTLNTEELKKLLDEEKLKGELNLTRYQRAQADFINFKRFTEQEKSDTLKFANANLLLNILPVIADFERGMAAIPHNEGKHKWVEGLKLIERKFQDVLQKQGVESIKTLGEEFDPRLMEAVTTTKGKKDIVLMEVEKGYKLFDKVIRPAKVVVGSGEEEAIKEE